MEGPAIAYVTCDNFSHIWYDWYEGFKRFWGLDLPCYFCGEELPAPFFTNLPHEHVEIGRWTMKLRHQIEQIPEEYIFVWLDDHVQQFSIDKEFVELVLWIRKNNPDSLRIMSRGSVCKYHHVDDILGRPLYKLDIQSRYRISFSPNIYQRDFLLDVLKRDESPWDTELYSTAPGERQIYSYHIQGWCINKIVH